MFDRHHMIWRWADHWDELGDWLPAAKDLVSRWADQSPQEVEFRNDFELRVACFLLYDNLLPESAAKALSFLFLETMSEARDKGYRLDRLHVIPEKRGRKRDVSRMYRQWELRELLKAGTPKMEAYSQIAEKYAKSTDTIRREYERIEKQSAEREKS
ncbi:MAG: hypothetical protein FKY71_07875 [Spiribacter salinus]|uniref:Uncharacterized protein n=1 Tax=Spiribacter salinus TaxID=1335746 RepID=A0A540VS40_9GAMM|nr:MAG: hypothetical protein FKY71_07875 [Spiribacter salinus]